MRGQRRKRSQDNNLPVQYATREDSQWMSLIFNLYHQLGAQTKVAFAHIK